MPLIIVWLGLFWRIASIADIPGTRRDLAGELVCTLAAGGLLVVSNLLLGPEVAALAALGPLILARLSPPDGRTAISGDPRDMSDCPMSC